MIKELSFGFICAAVGGFSLWSGIKAIAYSKQIVNWPTTQGVVLTSIIGIMGLTRGRTYVPTIKYSYTIIGQNYVGTHITLGTEWNSSSSKKADAKQQQYPIGQPCRVYYNPNDPAEAALEPASGRSAWSKVLAGVALILFGVFIMISNYNK
jgi:hypothetical protein